MRQAVLHEEDSAVGEALYVAFELSRATWKLAFGVGTLKVSVVSVPARDLAAVEAAMTKAKERFGLAKDSAVRSCFEAGRDGFWLHRELERRGVSSVVIDPASIEVDRRARRAKTDKLDGKRLLALLYRQWNESTRVWSVVRVPTVEAEDQRRLQRELERLKKERTAHQSRINSLLMLQGIDFKARRTSLAQIDQLRLIDGSALPGHLRRELRREHERLELVYRQINELVAERDEQLEQPASVVAQKTALLMSLRGVGGECASTCARELFAWRTFDNRRQLAAAVGLTPTPFQSGDGNREQGISKAGNRRVRRVLVQCAWLWLQYQPESALSRWFNERFGHGRGRMRRVGIIGLARRLLIALWRFVEDGVVPDGAQLKTG